ncbi:MAG: DUF58 domain-containing protein [Candidatus Zipacnadales bacterium]
MISAQLLERIHRIEIRARRLVNDVFAGEYRSAFRGRGVEFQDVRDYYPGDDIRTIDWNVTARARKPYVRRYQEERELTVVFLVDASRSVRFGSGELLKGEVAAEICAVLALSAIRNNDKVGLAVFTDRVEFMMPPAKGRMQVLRLIREVLAFQPQHRGTSIRAALEWAGRALVRRAVVFLISDFLDDGYQHALNIVNRKHDVIAVNITDPREEELVGVGLLELEDAETGRRVTINTASQRLPSRVVRREELCKELARLDVDLVSINAAESYIEPLVRFFSTRAKRLR